jgi:hypothetical protein
MFNSESDCPIWHLNEASGIRIAAGQITHFRRTRGGKRGEEE